jgi:cytochrome P450
VFGEKANDFRPDRRLESTPEKLQDMNDIFCVFGRGKRRSLGQDLAWMILEKTVAAVSTILHDLGKFGIAV